MWKVLLSHEEIDTICIYLSAHLNLGCCYDPVQQLIVGRLPSLQEDDYQAVW